MSKKSSGTRSKSTAMRKKSTATTKTTKKSNAKPARQKGAQGISNRMSAGDEARDQKRHPPIDAGSVPFKLFVGVPGRPARPPSAGKLPGVGASIGSSSAR